MKQKNIDMMREVRLWTRDIIVPLGLGMVMLVKADILPEKVESVKNYMWNFTHRVK